MTPAAPLTILGVAKPHDPRERKMAATLDDLATEISAIRLVLVHVMAGLSYEARKNISERISLSFEQPPGGHPFGQSEIDSAPWAAPYRKAIDELLAQAEKISAAQK
jgi:hypothetical protein